ncbi:Uncharacterised protein [Cedecea neteri]|uniref:Uncharacterized protein n=1 Tax=Cedecea neteri TaxID=158822 RepID=A0A2X3JCG9_9ENTR|nr:Uncharacterised protein [Cedecea neteri]
MSDHRRLNGRALAVLFPAPAHGQVAVERVVGAGLVGHHIRAHAAFYQLRQNFCRITVQGDRNGFPFAGVAFEAGEGVIQIFGLLVDITSAQAEVDA